MTGCRARLALLCALALALAGGAAGGQGPSSPAEPKYTIRFATVAPAHSGWAKEIEAWVRDVESRTHGEVHIKVYYGAMAGGELEMGQRMARGQLDGALSGEMLCRRLAPSMRVLGLPGLFQDREESSYVMSQLQPRLEKEMHDAGYVLLGVAGLGPTVILSRKPLATMADFHGARAWTWDADDMGIEMRRELGFDVVPETLEDAAGAYDEGKVDAFLAIPAAALVFQWYAQARYVTDLHIDYLVGCALVPERAFDALPADDQRVFRDATAKLVARMDDLSRQEDTKLLGGVFEKQGIKSVPVTETLRAGFFESARKVRDKLAAKWVPRELEETVTALLADYRAEHRQPRSKP